MSVIACFRQLSRKLRHNRVVVPNSRVEKPTIMERKAKRLWMWSLVAVVILAFATGAVSLLLMTQLRAREFSALQSVRIVVKAAANYHKKFGTYPPALQDLATYEEGWCEGYATEPVFTGEYSGYRFAYEAPSPVGSRDKFFISAVPFARESRGGREFCADQSGAIRVATKGITCTVNSDELREEDEFSRLKLP